MTHNSKRSILLTIFAFIVLAPGLSAQTHMEEQRAVLQQMSAESSRQWQEQRAEAEAIARRAGIPIRQRLADGTIIELQKFENGLPVYFTTHNLEAAQLSSIDAIRPGGISGLDLTGEGRLVGMWEGGGPLLTHQELTGRVTYGNDDMEASDHATHVAGTIMASGVETPATGMAPEAEIISYTWDDHKSEMALAAGDGLLVSNHSWGTILGWRWDNTNNRWYWYGDTDISETTDYRFGFYDSRAAEWDKIAYQAPHFVIVKSAGNDRNDRPLSQPVSHLVWDKEDESWVWSSVERDPDGGADGYTSLGSSSTSKNVIVVGAVAANKSMSAFSGWGPTNDGRIKPDIVAKGVDVVSPIADGDTAYDTKNGTSMAAPVVTGAVTLLQQHYRNLFDDDPRSSTIRALLIHTADPMGISDGPDYRNGWGLLNARRAAEVLSEDAASEQFAYVQELSLLNNTVHEYRVWSNGEEPLTATIAWTDPEGTPVEQGVGPTDLMLVNDLDMRIIHDGRDEFKPWILDPSNPADPASTGDNYRDNVEQVYVEIPEPGYYTIRITHKGTTLKNGQQPFALVVTGQSDPLVEAGPAFLTFSDADGQGYAMAPNNTHTDLSGDWLTIEFWVNMDASSDDDAVILSKKVTSSATSNGYMVRTVGGGEERPLLFAPTSNSNWHVQTRSGIRAGEWTHVSAVYQDGDVYIYLNGELDAENTRSSNSLGSNNNPLILGANQSRNGQFFRGHIDDLRIWSSARNMFDIRADFTGPLNGDEPGLRVYYPFIAEGSSIATDLTMRGTDLTLVDIAGNESPGVFPVSPLVYGRIGDQSATLKIEERAFARDVAESFRIYRSAGGERTEVAVIDAGDRYFTDGGLDNGTTYYYEVTTINEDGYEGHFSNPLSLTPRPRTGGSSVAFGGLGYLALSNRPALDISDNELTIEVWIMRDPVQTGMQALLTREDSPGSTGYGLYLVSGGEEARVRFTPTGNSNWHLTSNRGIRSGEWTHVAAVYHNGNTQIYINGVLDAESVRSPNSMGSTSNDLVIGSNVQRNGLFFHGQIDELKIWNRQRTVTEIISDFNRPLWGNEEGLAGYWRFDASDDDRMYGQAMRPATAEATGNVTFGHTGVYPLPPRIHARPDLEDGRITLHVSQPAYAADQVSSFRIYRYSDGQSPSLLATLPADSSWYHDFVESDSTAWYYEATILDQFEGESDRSYPALALLHEERPAGNAVRFETNQSSYISFEYNPALDISGGEITVEAWIRKDPVSQQGSYILGNNSFGSPGYALVLEDEGPSSRIRFAPRGNTNWHVISETSIEPDEWVHVAGVLKDGTSSIYINGALDNQRARTPEDIGVSPHGLVIGANHLGSGNYFIGEIDEVRIWNRHRDQQELLSSIMQPLTGHENGLIGYWRFDEIEGDRVHSSAVRPLYGARVNGPLSVPSAAMEGEPFVPRPILPQHQAVEQDIPLHFSWHPVSNALYYELEISRDVSFRSVIFEKEIYDTSRTVELGLAYDSTYHWRVRAVTHQFVTGWSDAWQFSTLLPVPDAPHWEPDDHGKAVELPVHFAWAASDYAETYRLQVSLDSDFEIVAADTANIADTELVLDDLAGGVTYYWRVSAGNRSGESGWSATRSFTTVVTRSGDPAGEIPVEFALDQNYPNPFNPSTTIRFSLPESVPVYLEVYNVTGERIATLVNGQQMPTGRHSVTFDASGLSSGMYVYRLRAGDFVRTRPMILVK